MPTVLKNYEKKSPNARVGDGRRTRLGKAVSERNEPLVEALLAHPKIQVDRPGTSGDSPLIRLMHRCSYIFSRTGPSLHANDPDARNMVRLLQAGANPHQSFKGRSALVHAALEPFAAQQLLARGADPHACPQHHPFTESLKKSVPHAAEFWWARSRPHPQVPEHNPWLGLLPSLLPPEVPVPSYATVPRLPPEVAWGWAERLLPHYPLDLRFPPSPRPSGAEGVEGDTPLMAACRAGCTTTVDWLLDHRADAALGVGADSPFSVWLKQRNQPSRRFDVAERLFAAIPSQTWEVQDTAAATLITACAMDPDPAARAWGWGMLRRLTSSGFRYPGYSTESAKALEFWGMLNADGAWEEGVDVLSKWPGWRANQHAGADTRLVRAMLGVVVRCAPDRLTPEWVRRWREAGLNWHLGDTRLSTPTTALGVLCQVGLEEWAHRRRFPGQTLSALLAGVDWTADALSQATKILLRTPPGQAPEGFTDALALFRDQGVDFLSLAGDASLESLATNNPFNLGLVLDMGLEVPPQRVSSWPEAGQRVWAKIEDRKLRERLERQVAAPTHRVSRPRM